MENKRASWSPFNKTDSVGNLDILSGDGIYLYDENNKKYIDAYSGLWNMHYGYSDVEIKNAIKEQLDQLPYVNPIVMNTRVNNELSNILCNITHRKIKKIIYTCSGSEATEVAIKLCRKYADLKQNKRTKIAVFENSYHGNYYGSMSASYYEGSLKDGYGPMLSGFVSLKTPFCRCCKSGQISKNCLDTMLNKLDEELRLYRDELCGIIIEPVIASGGIMSVPEEYMKRLYEFCLENDVLLVCDEVAAGFGRTGYMFAFQKYKIHPHIITMSKGIDNGYLPLGAVGVSENIVEEFQNADEVLFHLSTQNGNPVCLAAAVANIKKMMDSDIISMVGELSKSFRKSLTRELNRYVSVFDIRIEGLMIAIDLVDEVTQLPISQKKLNLLMQHIYSLGCIVGTSFVEDITSSILLFPQYIIKKAEITQIAKIISQAIAVII